MQLTGFRSDLPSWVPRWVAEGLVLALMAWCGTRAAGRGCRATAAGNRSHQVAAEAREQQEEAALCRAGAAAASQNEWHFRREPVEAKEAQGTQQRLLLSLA